MTDPTPRPDADTPVDAWATPPAGAAVPPPPKPGTGARRPPAPTPPREPGTGASRPPAPTPPAGPKAESSRPPASASDTPSDGSHSESDSGGSHSKSDSGGSDSDSGSKTDQAKGAAKDVAGDAKEAGRSVAQTATSEAASVKDDAVREGRRLLDETTSTLNSQASDQLNRAGSALRSLSDDLGKVAQGDKPEQGLVTDLAGQINERTDSLAGWLENHEPSDVLEEVKRFARRRPLAFLGIAAGVGLLAGRLTRGVVENHTDDDDQSSGQASSSGQAAPDGRHLDYSSAAGYGETTAVPPRPEFPVPADRPVAPNPGYPDGRGGQL